MPRVIVVSESATPSEATTTLDERVTPADIRSGHHAAQLIERVGWAVHDADAVEEAPGSGRPDRPGAH